MNKSVADGGMASASVGRIGIAPPVRLLRDLLSGLVVSGIFIAYCVTFGALIFSGTLAAGLPLGLNSILLGAGISGIVVALFSSLPRAVGGPDTPAVAVLSVLALSVAAVHPADADPHAMVVQVLTAISITTLLTGILLFLLGAWRLGWLARFIPYSVVAGFLAASGCLLIGGAFRVATGSQFSWNRVAQVVKADPAAGERLLFALLLVASVFILRLRFRQFYVLPAVIGIGIAAVHVFLAAGGLSIEQAGALGWFLDSPFGAGLLVPVAEPGALAAVWPTLADRFGEIAAVAVVTTMGVILNTTGLEAVWKANANLNREFQVAGVANILSGGLGGIAGYISLNRSMLNGECGAVGRLSAVVPGLACLSLLLFDTGIMIVFPTPVLAALLLFLGVSILVNTLGWSSPRRDWPELLHIFLITGVILLIGFLEGLLVGLTGACILFAYSYSRVDIIKHELTRCDRASSVDRPAEQSGFLVKNGQLIRIVELQGYLFFATSSRLAEHLKGRIHGGRNRVGYLILDFRLVTGLDISTALSFAKLRNTCAENGVTLILCGMSPTVAKVIAESKQYIVDGAVVREFPSLDQGLDWAEEHLLLTQGAHLAPAGDFEAWLHRQFGDNAIGRQILPYMVRLEFRKGEQLVAQGGPSDSVDLVASGRVRVMLERPGGPPIRLRSMLGQTVLGEMGFYRGSPRAASVIAEQDTVVYRLRRVAFDRMIRDNPEAAAAFHQFIICVLADRLTFANTAIASLER